MKKLKTHKSAFKRIKIKKHFFCRKSAGMGHLFRKKSSKQLRRLSVSTIIHKHDIVSFSSMLPYK